MTTIWKFELNQKLDRQKITMPLFAEILCLAVQSGTLCLWARVETSQPTEEVELVAIGTGQEITDLGLEYIGTVQSFGGNLVLHYFKQNKLKG